MEIGQPAAVSGSFVFTETASLLMHCVTLKLVLFPSVFQSFVCLFVCCSHQDNMRYDPLRYDCDRSDILVSLVSVRRDLTQQNPSLFAVTLPSWLKRVCLLVSSLLSLWCIMWTFFLVQLKIQSQKH